MTDTQTTWDMLHTARIRDMRTNVERVWRHILSAYTGSEMVLSLPSTYLPDLYPWYQSAARFATQFNDALRQRGYDREVRVLLNELFKHFADPNQRIFLLGPMIEINFSYVMMPQSHEMVLAEMSKLFTLLDHAGKVAAGKPDGVPTATDKIVRDERSTRCFEAVAVFLRNNA